MRKPVDFKRNIMSTHPDQKHLIEAFMGGSWGYFGDWNSLMKVSEKIIQHVYEVHNVDDGVMQYTEAEHAFVRTFGMIDREGNFMFSFNRGQLYTGTTPYLAAFEAVCAWITDYNEGIYNQKTNP